MARITVEDCLEVVDNRFELVMMAAKRARQLANGVEPPLDNTENDDKPTVLALREIAARQIDQPLHRRGRARPSASARSARRWNGPPPKWCRRRPVQGRRLTDAAASASRIDERPALRGRFSFRRGELARRIALQGRARRLAA